MLMPWQCFICASDQHDCGHRELELVTMYLGDALHRAEAEEKRRREENAQRKAWREVA